LGKVDFPIGEKLDEATYQGIQGMGTTLYGAILQGVDDGLRKMAPKSWKNLGRESGV